MKKFEIENHHPSYLPDGEWKLIWADEFDGMELDRTKWDYRLHMANKRHECFIEDAVSFDGNSHIIFHLVEKDGQYYSSALQTGETDIGKNPAKCHSVADEVIVSVSEFGAEQ